MHTCMDLSQKFAQLLQWYMAVVYSSIVFSSLNTNNLSFHLNVVVVHSLWMKVIKYKFFNIRVMMLAFYWSYYFCDLPLQHHSTHYTILYCSISLIWVVTPIQHNYKQIEKLLRLQLVNTSDTSSVGSLVSDAYCLGAKLS